MESKCVNDQDTLIDLESGNGTAVINHSNDLESGCVCACANGCPRDDRNNQHMDCSSPASDAVARSGDDRKSEGEEKLGLGLLDSSGGDKAKKKRSKKKPPRPPRPLTPTPLDVSDQKLLNELSELAVLKRARVERMKALKKMKNAKQGFSGGNLCPLIVTVIFCVVILWQGFFSGHGPAVSFHGSPESSIRGTRSSLISIRFYKNHSNTRPPPFSETTAAPEYVWIGVVPRQPHYGIRLRT
ncbi:uncharacterized protein [Zea mays]|uniref:Uncharacterized protein n=2 Tax=Zea mays TaxID=4577 RepID=A0A804UM18_MAIZE|nr:uncharacterized protein LOC100276554 isoform X2 [Zea mays]|eukprot:XP_008661729.1 uncharacterized protein LOC100276554 isoform X2 [Zea mays]